MALPAGWADSFPISDCQECHGEADFWEEDEAARMIIDVERLQESVHGQLVCTDCHAGIPEAWHEDVPKPQCIDCHAEKIGRELEVETTAIERHAEIGKEYATSIHGASQQMGGEDAASCADCHGTHYIPRVDSLDSPVFKFNLPNTCAKCHSNTDLIEEYNIPEKDVPTHFAESIHGQALLQKGLIVAPSCNDCHGVHDIKRSVNKSSPINHANIGKTCGKCHVGVEQIYMQSIHGRSLMEGNAAAPICTDCHTAHDIVTREEMEFKKAISDERCGSCHLDRLENYHETYHGKAMELGQPNVAPEVAACYDCHGHHDILPADNPDSRLSKENIVDTCQQCHPKANASFAQYVPHADPLDATNYPVLNKVFLFMTVLLIGVFAFFGLHTILWLLRSLYLYLHDSKKFREAKVETQQGDEWFTRFSPFERFLHLLVVSSFLLLVLTGMPLKFYYTEWAQVLFNIIGGAPVARSLHHFGALITFLYFVLHLASLAVHSWQNRHAMRDPETGKWRFRNLKRVIFGPDSMVPTIQDWRDFWAHQRWFFGKAQRPQFDRWTYWEKFDYLAVFWGVFAIGLSGMVLWFPEFFSKFLPGWFINIAIIVHSDEALLAAGFIFTIHFFNTHFRLEKFPMDTVIFSGRISKSEMLHDRKRWYDRLIQENRLDHYRLGDEWDRWRRIARSMGYIFFGSGLVLLVLIIYAMTSRLVH